MFSAHCVEFRRSIMGLEFMGVSSHDLRPEANLLCLLDNRTQRLHLNGFKHVEEVVKIIVFARL